MSDNEAPTRNEMRAAVGYGQLLAVRELLDALRKARPGVGGWVPEYDDGETTGIPSRLRWEPEIGLETQRGFDAAITIVRRYRVDGNAELVEEPE